MRAAAAGLPRDAVVVVGEQHLCGAGRNATAAPSPLRAQAVPTGSACLLEAAPTKLAHTPPSHGRFHFPTHTVCVSPESMRCARSVCGVSVLSAMANPFIKCCGHAHPIAWAVFFALSLPRTADRRLAAGMQCALVPRTNGITVAARARTSVCTLRILARWAVAGCGRDPS